MDSNEIDHWLYAPPSPHFSPNSTSSQDSQFSRASNLNWSPPLAFPAHPHEPLTCTFSWDHTVTTSIDLDFDLLTAHVYRPEPHSVGYQLRDLIIETLGEDGYVLVKKMARMCATSVSSIHTMEAGPVQAATKAFPGRRSFGVACGCFGSWSLLCQAIRQCI